jgi:hypothetical protein
MSKLLEDLEQSQLRLGVEAGFDTEIRQNSSRDLRSLALIKTYLLPQSVGLHLEILPRRSTQRGGTKLQLSNIWTFTHFPFDNLDCSQASDKFPAASRKH